MNTNNTVQENIPCSVPQNSSPVLNSRFLRGMGGASLFLACTVFIFGVLEQRDDNTILELWIETQATILKSEVKSEVKTESWGNGTREIEVFHPSITYEYNIDGVQYSENTLNSEKPGISKAQASDIAAQYPEFSLHNIKVNPQNPEVSILIKNSRALEYTFIMSTVILLLLGTTGLFLSFSHK